MRKRICQIRIRGNQAMLQFYHGYCTIYPKECFSLARERIKLEGNRVVWTESPNGSFSVRSAWGCLRPRGPSVVWHKIVWFSRMIPRHAMILWLAMRKRLSTLDKLAAFGITQRTRCILCEADEENHEHLFFSCSFSVVSLA